MIRRNLLTAMGGISIMIASKEKLLADSRSVTYVLVHGAWHGGWCWKYVREFLEASGHKVFAPSLTGLGDRVHMRNASVNLSTHVSDIVNLIRYEGLSDIILVGHSYAGHVVSLVADKVKERIKHLVYLDAVLPTDGKAFVPYEVGVERMKIAKEGYLMDLPDMDFLGIPSDHSLYSWVKDNLVEHPLPTLTEVVRYSNKGPEGIPKTYVRCTKNIRMISGEADPVAEMTEKNPEWDYKLINTGHDLMVTAPKETAQILLNIR